MFPRPPFRVSQDDAAAPVRRPSPALALALFIAGSCSVATAGTTVAYIGDQGAGSGARAVLGLIRDEGVDVLVLQGDLGYDDGFKAWSRMMEEELDDDFPVLSVAGNHDRDEWNRYQGWLERRIDAADELRCSGDVGVKATCRFRDLTIVQTAPGVQEVSALGPQDDYAGFVDAAFARPVDGWRVCSFHKNQRDMQTGDKDDATGWPIYEACREAGAMVVTGHEHAYSRTHLLDGFEQRSVVHRESRIVLAPGRSIAIVSGLGGHEARAGKRGGNWWASIYTADQGASAGALLCDYGDYGDTVAECRFKSVDGAEPDRFTLVRAGATAGPSDTARAARAPATTRAASPEPPFVFSRTDKDELRWIERGASGQLGSIWISAACAERLGGVSLSGDWRSLQALAPDFDAVANPCASTAEQGGFVFDRTDKRELRWVATAADGRRGSIWISRDCAESLGGSRRRGDWEDLQAMAPALDRVDSPC